MRCSILFRSGMLAILTYVGAPLAGPQADPASPPASAQPAPPPSAPTPPAEPARDPFRTWLVRVRSRIAASAVPPKHMPPGSHRAVLAFTIVKDGTVSAVRIQEPSGVDVVDQAVLRALKKAAPFPPIPPEAGRAEVALTVPLRFLNEPPVKSKAANDHR